MANKVELRREALRSALVTEAEGIMAREGLGALRARDVARGAGCALGAIYSHFADMDALAAAVNARTLLRLEASVAQGFAALTEPEPAQALVLLGTTYAAFVRENPLLWSAIFELGFRGSGAQQPSGEHLRLLDLIARSLAPLLPEADGGELQRHARALFSAVHGIVSLAEQQRFMGVPSDAVADEITFVVSAFCAGLGQRR